MAMIDNVVLCDRSYDGITQVYEATKIKLKPVSHKRIQEKFNASRTEMKVEKPSIDESKENNPINKQERITSIIFLDVKGLINTEQSRMIKINGAGFENIKNNLEGIEIEDENKIVFGSEKEKETTEAPVVAPVVEAANVAFESTKDVFNVETPKNLEANENMNIPTDLNEQVDKNIEENKSAEPEIKVSANEASVANFRRYTADGEDIKNINPPTIEAKEPEQSISMEIQAPTIDEETVQEKVTPLTIDLQNAREVNIESVIKPADNVEIVEKSSTENSSELSLSESDITSLEKLQELLNKTAVLQEQADLAKQEAAEARHKLELAEEEREAKKETFIETAKSVLKHQQDLIKQAQASKEQETTYQTETDKIKEEQEQYDKAIADMLGVMSDTKEDSNSKTK